MSQKLLNCITNPHFSELKRVERKEKANLKAARAKCRNGIERKDTLEEIIGASTEIRADKALFFLVKWQGIKKKELILASEMNVAFPTAVIDFYEQHMQYEEEDDSESEEEDEPELTIPKFESRPSSVINFSMI